MQSVSHTKIPSNVAYFRPLTSPRELAAFSNKKCARADILKSFFWKLLPLFIHYNNSSSDERGINQIRMILSCSLSLSPPPHTLSLSFICSCKSPLHLATNDIFFFLDRKHTHTYYVRSTKGKIQASLFTWTDGDVRRGTPVCPLCRNAHNTILFDGVNK